MAIGTLEARTTELYCVVHTHVPIILVKYITLNTEEDLVQDTSVPNVLSNDCTCMYSVSCTCSVSYMVTKHK